MPHSNGGPKIRCSATRLAISQFPLFLFTIIFCCVSTYYLLKNLEVEECLSNYLVLLDYYINWCAFKVS